MDEKIIEKIMEKGQYSRIPREEIIRAFKKFDNENYIDEEKIKKTKNFLRKTFSGFGGKKILRWKFENRNPDDFLKKHLSTRERDNYYEEIYFRVLKNLPRKISVVDLGSGINSLSYRFFSDVGKEVGYIGIEALGQLVDLGNEFFKRENIDGRVYHFSLFDIPKLKELIEKTEKPRVVFMFKVVDALESSERDFTKKFLKEIVPLVDRVVISFATESWIKRKKFFVNRKWLTEFIKENWSFTDDFEVGGERYLVFE